jgi:hypothetical protein
MENKDCILFPGTTPTKGAALQTQFQAWRHLRTFCDDGASVEEFLDYLIREQKVRGPRDVCKKRVERLLKSMVELTGDKRVEVTLDGRYRAVEVGGTAR